MIHLVSKIDLSEPWNKYRLYTEISKCTDQELLNLQQSLPNSTLVQSKLLDYIQQFMNHRKQSINDRKKTQFIRIGFCASRSCNNPEIVLKIINNIFFRTERKFIPRGQNIHTIPLTNDSKTGLIDIYENLIERVCFLRLQSQLDFPVSPPYEINEINGQYRLLNQTKVLSRLQVSCHFAFYVEMLLHFLQEHDPDTLYFRYQLVILKPFQPITVVLKPSPLYHSKHYNSTPTTCHRIWNIICYVKSKWNQWWTGKL